MIGSKSSQEVELGSVVKAEWCLTRLIGVDLGCTGCSIVVMKHLAIKRIFQAYIYESCPILGEGPLKVQR